MTQILCCELLITESKNNTFFYNRVILCLSFKLHLFFSRFLKLGFIWNRFP